MRLEPASHRQIVTGLTIRGADLQAQTISILRPEDSASPIFHLAFDTDPPRSPYREIHPGEATADHVAESEDEQEVEAVEENSAIASGLLASLEQRLRSIAESGTDAGVEQHRAWFATGKSDLHRAGFRALASMLESLTNTPNYAPADLLKRRYLLQLHAQATQ